MERRLQLATNVAFLVLLLLGIAIAGRTLLKPAPVTVVAGNPLPPPAPVRTIPVYQPGEAVRIAGLDFGRAEQTVILVTRQGCRFCDASMPFYKQLGADETLRPRTRIVLVAPATEPASREELAKYGVRVDAVVQTPLALLKVRGTPTAIVVDRQGKVTKVMAGLLDEAAQKDLLTALRGGG